ncbi:glycosyl transferase family 41-domain-containing protein [Abortiporus biennis]|nr:glycosyl transferase family 41-domain-containing protein [Abortiporus biennis]
MAPTESLQVFNTIESSLNRDTLLAHAYYLYSFPGRENGGMTADPQQISETLRDTYRTQLIPLLTTLHRNYPQYIPILLLLSCAYHALGDFENSLNYSHQILALDPYYAEAMSNIGITLKAQGRLQQAYQWWWQALSARPLYWDVDNILALLLGIAQDTEEHQRYIMYSRALDVCTHVQRHALDGTGRFSNSLTPGDVPRLQRIFLTAATIRTVHIKDDFDPVLDLFRSIELVIRKPTQTAHTGWIDFSIHNLIIAAYIAAYIVCAKSGQNIPSSLLKALGAPRFPSLIDRLNLPNFTLLEYVQTSEQGIMQTLFDLGQGALPILLLLPDQACHLSTILFASTGGILSGLLFSDSNESIDELPNPSTIQQTNMITSTILLSLAKRFQDVSVTNTHFIGFRDKANVNHSLSILFYYLALALAPSPSIYNNLGILLSTLPVTQTDASGRQRELSGAILGRLYYESGLQLDPDHPHLLTNLGSHYKDQGDLDTSVACYLRAITTKPDFDVALANLGNTLKDMASLTLGRSWEAIEYYRRAIATNPELSEAICGLVGALTSICDWRGQGALPDELGADDSGRLINRSPVIQPGHLPRMLNVCSKQLISPYRENLGIVKSTGNMEHWMRYVELAYARQLYPKEDLRWRKLFGRFYTANDQQGHNINEAGFILRFADWLHPRIQRRWYVAIHGKCHAFFGVQNGTKRDAFCHLYPRFHLPQSLPAPLIPSILPFNTFTYPLSARSIRLITHRHALRISYMALVQPWLPSHVYPPPNPPQEGKLRIAYVSNDVNNHPLAHLMQSVFQFHDRKHFLIYLYTTSPWDGTPYRPRIAQRVEEFIDASSWSTREIVEDIVKKNIHILINLGGYTKGSRNDIFAARPCPIQIQLMGYPGTLGSGWCDYLVCDPIACPRELSAGERWRERRQHDQHLIVGDDVLATDESLDIESDLDPESPSEDWIYSEKLIYIPHTFMVTDHKQSFRQDQEMTDEERVKTPVNVLWEKERRFRLKKRIAVFHDLPQDYFIFANFNQVIILLLSQEIFLTWLRILTAVPRSILWLLRFPIAGEEHILRTARQWAGENVASRIRFTDVANKEEHIARGHAVDLFLDTLECNAHTIATDILWSGTPILTWPKHKYKMSSRVAASIVNATGFGDQMIVNSLAEYEERAISFTTEVGRNRLDNLRRNLFLNRDHMPLFDTRRWTRNIEKAFSEAWRRWVEGTQYELSDEWEQCTGLEKESGCIWVQDDEPVEIVRYEQ